MVRLSILAFLLLAVGVAPATAGVFLLPVESFPNSAPSMELVAELMQADDAAIPVSIRGFDGDHNSWAVSQTHGEDSNPVAVCQRFVLRGQQPLARRVMTFVHTLPPNPILEGLLKPA